MQNRLAACGGGESLRRGREMRISNSLQYGNGADTRRKTRRISNIWKIAD
jgi:hypothetical protein